MDVITQLKNSELDVEGLAINIINFGHEAQNDNTQHNKIIEWLKLSQITLITFVNFITGFNKQIEARLPRVHSTS